ncbi:hypothetical protein [Parahaliea mediterranea]|uniref:Uncharacterized protein n=1 Tax=Parahaliea mediterranea TaxID=651086 RepID=A0A939DER5_9GAMM|nr:hypothetical protein [Parahaliea mediterranea]MBN7796780.1 hypothetical protein [Parahaliea mediterranea]
MAKLARVLWLQGFYLLLAVGYNLFSLWLIVAGGEGLIQGRPPQYSIASLCLLLPVLALGARGKHRAYLLLNTPVMLLIAYTGIAYHVLNCFRGDMGIYLSSWAWSVAIAINVFGVFVGLWGSLACWRLQDRRRLSAGPV